MRRGGVVRHRVTELDAGSLLATEAALPSAKLRYRHQLEPDGDQLRITHSITVSGPLSFFWSLMLGRRKMRKGVAGFIERERELAEPKHPPKRSRRRRKGGRGG